MTRDDDELPDVHIREVQCIHATERAIRVLIRGRPHWIPQSVVSDDSEVYAVTHHGTLVIRGWWAAQEGIEP